MGGHQISGPEPGGQRQLGVVHDGSGSDRGLPTAAGALIGPGLGFQPPSLTTAAARAYKPVRPARRDKVFSAGGFIAKALLELDQGAGKVGHRGYRVQLRSFFVLPLTSSRDYNILCPRTQRDKAFPWIKGQKPTERRHFRQASAFHVRRDKAALFQWVQAPPGDRSSRKQ